MKMPIRQYRNYLFDPLALFKEAAKWRKKKAYIHYPVNQVVCNRIFFSFSVLERGKEESDGFKKNYTSSGTHLCAFS